MKIPPYKKDIEERRSIMRFQIEMSKDEAKEWDDLIKKTSGVKTKKDLINNALTLLEWAVNERLSGRIIAALDEEEMRYKELVMPVFPAIKAKKNKGSIAIAI